jgi:ubiquinone biosynthesis protein
MAATRALTNLLRALWVGVVVLGFGSYYLLRRFGLSFVRDATRQHAALSTLQGSVLRRAMGLLGACFVKLGQVMSSRPDLFEPNTIAELRLLQDRLPPFAFAEVRRAVEQQLGKPLTELFEEFDELPVAAASVAQVHRARLRGHSEVAVKVLRPNVRAQVERDGTLLTLGAKLLALHPVIRLSDPVGFTREFVRGLVRQTDLSIEAANYEQFRQNFAGDPRIAFPKVYSEFTGERVLVMEFVRGTKVDALPPGNHRALSQVLREATMKMCFVDGFMHADMHPGNMVQRDDGVLVLFDVGLATKLTPEVQEIFVDMVKCIAMGSPEDMIQHLRRFHLYSGEVDWDSMRKDLEDFGRKFRKQDVAQLDYGEMIGAILALGRRYHVRPIPELSLVIVGTVTVQGIGKMLAPEINDFQEMSKFLIPILMRMGQKVPETPEAKRAQDALR